MKEWLYPLHYERRYSRFLENLINEVRREFLARLQTLPQWDSDSVDLVLEETLNWWKTKREEKKRNYYGYFTLISAFNSRQFREVVKSGTGLTLPNPGQLSSPYSDLLARFGESADMLQTETWLTETQKNWTSNQDIYVDKNVNSALADSALGVKQAIVNALTAKAVIDYINEKFNKTSTVTSVFGKDQVSKLNVELQENRTKSLNLDEYEWITRRDERVRGNPAGLYPKAKPSHFAREGVIFRWNNPPEGGHPGAAPGCRCKARILFRK